MASIKDVAKAAEVSVATVSAVLNDTAYVSPTLRARVLAAIDKLDYAPSSAARNLKRGRSQLIALVVADLQNPFFARVVCAAEAAVAAWGYNLVVFNSDEKPDNERRVLARIRSLSCDGVIFSPIGAPERYANLNRDVGGAPVVLFGRAIHGQPFDLVTLDNAAAARRVTNYLLDLGHTRIGSMTGPLYLSTAAGRLQGMVDAMAERGLKPDPSHIRSGEFREEVAYSAALDMLRQKDRPSAIYAANGLMALGAMRALDDLSMTCPRDISIASTDSLPGVTGLRPRLTRTEHPMGEMIDQALRFLMERIDAKAPIEARRVVYSPELILGDSCTACTATSGAVPSPA
ncbi:LacI family DNA-binding transcriptional regulator [Acuticoccus sp. MNP-M23]|uniref:LacI family DNA-binding transcriptional regulator n=1 Tax=Acuticoccus sp. MNP-M23 TaxID=3072793 RepID=UPI0028158870|nr:LacI family DNA-binding transcriptional regulator [Acuticoccus sp. MNP-M23]WMS43911.1 LacI family DNA-binding transcriptional regulator [Acuticoccus sp. MNP-M23]